MTSTVRPQKCMKPATWTNNLHHHHECPPPPTLFINIIIIITSIIVAKTQKMTKRAPRKLKQKILKYLFSFSTDTFVSKIELLVPSFDS